MRARAAAAGRRDSSEVTPAIRAEDVVLTTAGEDAVAGGVQLLGFMGAKMYLHAAVADDVTCVVPGSADVDVSDDDCVGLRFVPGRLHIFGEDGMQLEGESSRALAEGAR
jgi:ABC-type sugar transport system ATPase subunit